MLTLGTHVLESFEEGLALLVEAEDGASLTLSGKAYASLMRLAQAEGRPLEALVLLSRAQAAGLRSDGALLGGMRAAASLEDWGVVARLYADLTLGPEEAAAEAVELETFSSEAAVLDDLDRAQRCSDAAAECTPRAAPPAEQVEYAEALTLALRAHCERGDATRAAEVVARMRDRGTALGPDEYAELLGLAKRTKRLDLLATAVRPADLAATAGAALEPKLWAATNRVGELGAALGTVERAIVAGAVVLTFLVAFGGVLGSTTELVAPDPLDF